MGNNGYFVKIGSYTFPNEYILCDTYKPIKGVQDLDSYRNAKGKLHRNVLDHVVNKVEFQTRPMTNKEYDAIMDQIRANYTIAKERKAMVDMYIAETGAYTGSIEAYMPDPEVTIKQVIDSSTLKYDSIRFAFIGY